MDHVVVVGGSLAGISAVEGLRSEGFTGTIDLIDAGRERPYDRPPLSKEVLSGSKDLDDIALRPETWFDEMRVSLRLGTRAVALDTSRRRLQLADGDDLTYDGLVIATGAVARALPTTADRPDRIHLLRTAADAERLRGHLVPGVHLAVIGGGFIGLEAAAVAIRLGCRVTLVETAETPLQRVLGSRAGSWFRDMHEKNGVEVLCATMPRHVEHVDGKDVIVLDDGRRIVADVVLAGVGARPDIDWLAGSGVVVGDGIECGPDLATSVPGVVAAGDAARWTNPLFGQSMRVEHWTNAVEQGRHAAATLLGRSEPYSPVPYFWSDQYEAKARFVGTAVDFDQIAVDVPKDGAFVALYGREGRLVGALCVNLPRRLADYRQAIQAGASFDELATSLATTLPSTARRARTQAHDITPIHTT